MKPHLSAWTWHSPARLPERCRTAASLDRSAGAMMPVMPPALQDSASGLGLFKPQFAGADHVKCLPPMRFIEGGTVTVEPEAEAARLQKQRAHHRTDPHVKALRASALHVARRSDCSVHSAPWDTAERRQLTRFISVTSANLSGCWTLLPPLTATLGQVSLWTEFQEKKLRMYFILINHYICNFQFS